VTILAYLNLMVGLPYSGKTKWIEENKKADEYVISADELRWDVYGQEFFLGGEAMVWNIRHFLLINTLRNNCNIIIDETNTTIERRSQTIKLAKKYGYKVNAIIINTDFSTCKKRFDAEYANIAEKSIKLKKLEKMAAMTRMNTQYQKPSKSEGFNNIIEIN
jgi:predicted kinase